MSVIQGEESFCDIQRERNRALYIQHSASFRGMLICLNDMLNVIISEVKKLFSLPSKPIWNIKLEFKAFTLI